MDFVKFLQDSVTELESIVDDETGAPLVEDMNIENTAHVLYAVAKIVLDVEKRTAHHGGPGQ